MLSNVASTQFSCDRLVPSLFTVPNFTKTLWLTVELVITTEQSAVTLNNVHCTSDVCISLFQDFQQFHSWYFQRRKKFRPRQLGPRMPGGGPCALNNLNNLLLWYCTLHSHQSSDAGWMLRDQSISGKTSLENFMTLHPRKKSTANIWQRIQWKHNVSLSLSSTDLQIISQETSWKLYSAADKCTYPCNYIRP